jgi:hypothetical protein
MSSGAQEMELEDACRNQGRDRHDQEQRWKEEAQSVLRPHQGTL